MCAREDRWQLLFHAFVLVPAAVYANRFLAFYVIPAVLAGYLAGYRLLVEHIQEPNRDRSFLTTIRSTCDHHLGLSGWVLFKLH